MTALINGVLMPVTFNGENIVVALDPSKEGDDQRVVLEKSENEIVFTVKARYAKKQRRRIKLSPFINA